jgi:hypothetical protein
VSITIGWSTPSLTSRSSSASPPMPGHAHVEHDGADALALEACSKGLRIGPGLHAQADAADQQRQPVAHGRRRRRSRWISGEVVGTFTVALAGCGSAQAELVPRAAARWRPSSAPPMLCARVSHRLRPRPRPPGRV